MPNKMMKEYEITVFVTQIRATSEEIAIRKGRRAIGRGYGIHGAIVTKGGVE